MNFDPVAIFLLIGFSHWMAHAMTCSACRETVNRNVSFIMEGMVKTFGWPVHLAMYLLDYFHPRRSGLTEADVELHVKQRVKELMTQSDGGLFLELSQEEGESDEAFNARIRQSMQNIAAGIVAKRKDGEENENR